MSCKKIPEMPTTTKYSVSSRASCVHSTSTCKCYNVHTYIQYVGNCHNDTYGFWIEGFKIHKVKRLNEMPLFPSWSKLCSSLSINWQREACTITLTGHAHLDLAVQVAPPLIVHVDMSTFITQCGCLHWGMCLHTGCLDQWLYLACLWQLKWHSIDQLSFKYFKTAAYCLFHAITSELKYEEKSLSIVVAPV